MTSKMFSDFDLDNKIQSEKKSNLMTVKARMSQIKSYMDILRSIPVGKNPRKIYLILDNKYAKSVFNYCYGLSSITIPDRVTSIGDLASHYMCFGEDENKVFSVDISKKYYEWDEMYDNYVGDNGKELSCVFSMAFLANVAFYVPPVNLSYREEEYLSTLLVPYIGDNKVIIAKETYIRDSYRLHCIFENNETGEITHTVFPEFSKDSGLYDCMEADRTYLLYELGLTDI